jgi:hypothetical protein
MIQKRTILFLSIVALILISPACSFGARTATIKDAVLTSDPEVGLPTQSFTPDDTFYLIVELDNAPNDTLLKSTWVAVRVDDVEPDFVIDEVEITTGLPIVTFDLANPYPWPTGVYRVDLYLNGELVLSLDFVVRE